MTPRVTLFVNRNVGEVADAMIEPDFYLQNTCKFAVVQNGYTLTRD
jgi:hypothetical protein